MINTKNSYVLPVNKTVRINNNKSIFISNEEASKQKISVICCTNRDNTKSSILNNYLAQTFPNKELIIILNNNQLSIESWKKYFAGYDDISIYKIDQSTSLGNCLNFGVSKSKYPIISKFDDDDYYGKEYLLDSVKPFLYTDAMIVGKYTTYVYFKQHKLLAIRNPKRENRFSYRVEGSTLLFRKSLFNKINFRNKNLGEDIQLCKDCIAIGQKIFSNNKLHHVYIRHGNTHKHTFGISDSMYINLCKKITVTEDYKKYLNF